MKTQAALLAALSLFITAAAEEADTRNSMDRYRGDGQFYMTMCKLNLKLALVRAEIGQTQDEKSDWSTCIHQGRETAKANLPAALKSVKKAKAKEAFKNYHVALVTAIDGIAPGVDERKFNYEQRQQMLAAKLTEAWARFEVEQ